MNNIKCYLCRSEKLSITIFICFVDSLYFFSAVNYFCLGLLEKLEAVISKPCSTSGLIYLLKLSEWYFNPICRRISRLVFGVSRNFNIWLALSYSIAALTLLCRSLHHFWTWQRFHCSREWNVNQEILTLVVGLYWGMNRKGNCWDNTLAENFFKTLKVRIIYGNKLIPKQQMRI